MPPAPLPLSDGNERWDLWHPVVLARAIALCADPRMRGELRVESAVRDYTEQSSLYQGWLAALRGEDWAVGRFNLAANPDQWLTPAYGLASARGSWHMAQPQPSGPDRGYAIDFETSVLSPPVYEALPHVAAEYRLVQTVLHAGERPPPSPAAPAPAFVTPRHKVKEWWHFQPPYNEAPLLWVPESEDPMTPEERQALVAEITRTNKAVVKEVVAAELRAMLGAGTPTRELLEAAVAEARDSDDDIDTILERLPTKVPVGGFVVRLTEIDRKLDELLAKGD